MVHKLLGIELPLIQAPMAGATPPQLVAAVSNCGALGSLGAGYMSPKTIRKNIQEIRSLTDHPFAVNLFIPSETLVGDTAEMEALLNMIGEEYFEGPFETPSMVSPSFEEQLEVIMEENVPVFSFTFGRLFEKHVRALQDQGTFVYGTATTPNEAKELELSGVDAIVLQGLEAGGHRGNFSSPQEELDLEMLIQRTEVSIPLIAAGGIMDQQGVTRMLNLGADAVQLGTAFLSTKESGAHPVHKKALLDQGKTPTKITDIYTGKRARGIENVMMKCLEDHPIPPYPIQHFLTKALRAMSAQNENPEFMSLWAGTNYPKCQDISVKDLIKELCP
ncbi:MAG: Nitronate monooxygenase [Chlamydiia bacterium]|nr:Nitronate monooxygenase [Chlamydiia bacterium]MCH9615273.1 Nitronate monooxygenase [Chlamydiia bacterium]MCH9628405.1 Nitronate monooxygenase [Chlamydiia bacterium]